MKQLFDFDEIRPLYDEEVPGVIEELLKEPGFQNAVNYIMPGADYNALSELMLSITGKDEFQKKLAVPVLQALAKRTSDGLSMSGAENIDKQESYTYMSNHRDIVLDTSFLNVLLSENGIETSEVAIGDNLLIFPWIENIVRLNKSFIVKRDVPVRKMLEVAKRLSLYIHFAIQIKHHSVWIAQREGRAKDSDDRTQESVLKMLNLGGYGTVKENLMDLNIAPVSISYEYDPCDYLKAKEFQLKRDDPEYKKPQREDLLNMETGILGYKGRIHFHIGRPINKILVTTPAFEDKNEEYSFIANLIDQEIYLNYNFYPGNYVAYDMLTKSDRFAKQYTKEEKQHFTDYLQKQLEKIDLPNPDTDFLTEKILEMYANTLKNNLKAKGEII